MTSRPAHWHSREVHLVRRPVGTPTHDDFALVETKVVGDPPPGFVVVRNDWVSVDPYMRGRMNKGKSYIPAFELGVPMSGTAVGTVVASRHHGTPVGARVRHELGWREYAVVEGGDIRQIDAAAAPADAYLGILGMTGLTAYVGLTRIAPVQHGDTVFISGAGGAVGLAAKTVARSLGATTIIGSAGGPDKVRRLVEEFGYDAAIDYRAGNLRQQLRNVSPRGIDVYFDNVSGDHLSAALSVIRDNARIALCGAISSYNAAERLPGPDNLGSLIVHRASMRGFIVFDHFDLYEEYIPQALQWMQAGELPHVATVVDGIENAVDAFLGLETGANIGKMVVRLATQTA